MALDCERMASTLLDFLYAIRFHRETAVRRAVLFALASLAKNVPCEALVTRMRIFFSWFAPVCAGCIDMSCYASRGCTF